MGLGWVGEGGGPGSHAFQQRRTRPGHRPPHWPPRWGSIIQWGLRGRVGKGWGSEPRSGVQEHIRVPCAPLHLCCCLGAPVSPWGPPPACAPTFTPYLPWAGQASSKQVCVCLRVRVWSIFKATLQLCFAWLHSPVGAWHVAHCGVILGLALLGVIFCVCKETASTQAELGGT